MKLNYTLEARLEAMEAVIWYFEQEKELAAEFPFKLRRGVFPNPGEPGRNDIPRIIE